MPTAPAISAWGCFGAGANSSQAHSPFATPRHEQIEKHSPFPAPYMEQISVKEIIQPEGVIQIIPNSMMEACSAEIPLYGTAERLRSPGYVMHRTILHEATQRTESHDTVREHIFQPLPLKPEPRAAQPLCPATSRALVAGWLLRWCREVNASHIFAMEPHLKWNEMNPLQNATPGHSSHFTLHVWRAGICRRTTQPKLLLKSLSDRHF